MFLASLELRDFRRYEHVRVELGPGVTVIEGLNGAGKTTLLEAVAWVALGRSFRGVPDAALVRDGGEAAIVRAAVDADGRRQTLDAELRATGRNRVLVNGHPLARSRDRLDLLRVTIFAPDDLVLVKGGPSGRREYLDDLLVVLAPRYEAARADYDKVLRHRNALLKGGARGPDAETTLDVFDDQLARAGAELVRGRLRLVERLAPEIAAAYEHLAGRAAVITGRYEADWAPDWARDGRARSSGGSRWSDPIATSGASCWMASTPVATRPRASSAASRWGCASPATRCVERPSTRRRCCSSTMCSPSSTTNGRRPSPRRCPPDRP